MREVGELRDGGKQVGVIPGRAAVDHDQHRQSRIPEPSGEQLDPADGDYLRDAFGRDFRHWLIMQAERQLEGERDRGAAMPLVAEALCQLLAGLRAGRVREVPREVLELGA